MNPLFEAKTADDVHAVIEKRYLFNQIKRGIGTPLHVACQRGRFEVVDALLNNGASIQYMTDFDYLNGPLQCGAINGNLNIVKRLLQEGIGIDNTDKDGTALYYACLNGNIDVIDYLLELGANVNKSVSKTPLMAACEFSKIDAVDRLLAVGADINVSIDKKTALTYACLGGCGEIFDKLILNGASISYDDPKVWSPLLAAIRGTHIKIVEKLFNLGIDVNEEIGDGVTPLEYTIKALRAGWAPYEYHDMQINNIEFSPRLIKILEIILQQGPDTSFLDKIKNKKSYQKILLLIDDIRKNLKH